MTKCAYALTRGISRHYTLHYCEKICYVHRIRISLRVAVIIVVVIVVAVEPEFEPKCQAQYHNNEQENEETYPSFPSCTSRVLVPNRELRKGTERVHKLTFTAIAT